MKILFSDGFGSCIPPHLLDDKDESQELSTITSHQHLIYIVHGIASIY